MNADWDVLEEALLFESYKCHYSFFRFDLFLLLFQDVFFVSQKPVK